MGWLQGGKNLKEAPAYGADVLRLWVASVDYNSDVLIGDRILSQVLVILESLSQPYGPQLCHSQVIHALITSQSGVWSLMCLIRHAGLQA